MQHDSEDQERTDLQDEDVESSEESTIEIDDIEIPLEKATREEIVEFLNDKLAAALTESGGVYISLPGMCRALGLQSPSQVRRIKGTKSLLKGFRRIPVKTKGGRQPVNFLRVDLIGLWLGGIDTIRMKQTTDKQRFLKEKIERYQDELAPLATQVFLRVLNEPSQIVPQLTIQAPQTEGSALVISMSQQLTTLSDVVPGIQKGMAALLQAAGTQTIHLENLLEMSSAQEAKLQSLLEFASSQTLDLAQAVELLSNYLQHQEDLEEKIERLDERTKRLSPAHALEIQNAVGHIVKAIRRKNPSITESLAHKMIYGRLKNRFRPVTSYREIDDDRFEEAMEFLRKEYRSVLEDGPQQPRLF